MDVIDLDYGHTELWDYQIETLKQWAEVVDGFRCDVAPLIPLDFWLKARQEVAKVNPDCFWLSESVEPVFTRANRARGMVSLSDSEIFQAFDACYEYDIFSCFRDYLQGKVSLKEYVDQINMQEAIYPDNYVKLRYLENHDNSRAAFLIPDKKELRNWTAFIYFQKGMTLLYAGQEIQSKHLPSLFDRDMVEWNWEEDISEMFRKLYLIKKHPLLMDSSYEVRALPKDIIYATHRRNGKQLAGIFSVRGCSSSISVDIPDGFYKNLLDNRLVEVHAGRMSCQGEPIILESSYREG